MEEAVLWVYGVLRDCSGWAVGSVSFHIGEPCIDFQCIYRGLLLLASPGAVGYVLSDKLYEYVVTNQRTILRWFGKVVKEVPLSTPELGDNHWRPRDLRTTGHDVQPC